MANATRDQAAQPEIAPLVAPFLMAAQMALSEVPVWLPARVTAWHPPETLVDGREMPASVDCQILLKKVRELTHTGNAVEGETIRSGENTGGRLEAVSDYLEPAFIPVCYPGPRGLRIRGPMEVGEQGILLCSTREIGRWIQGDAETEGGPVDPFLGIGWGNIRRACFIPGLEVAATEGAGFPLTSHALGDAEGVSSLDLDGLGGWTLTTPTGIKLGSDAASLTLAYQAQTKAVLTALQAFFTAELAFWNGYVPVTPDGIAQKTFWTTTATPLFTALTAALAAHLGTLKTTAE